MRKNFRPSRIAPKPLRKKLAQAFQGQKRLLDGECRNLSLGVRKLL